MLTDHELHNYLHELGVLHGNENTFSENSHETHKEFFHGLAHQILEDKKENPPAQAMPSSMPPREKENTRFSVRMIVLVSVFCGGIIAGFFLGSMHKTPFEKLTDELQKAVKAFEALDFDKLNPEPIKEHIIAPLHPGNAKACLTI